MPKILIVDDDPAQTARWKQTLESAGYMVASAPDAILGLIAITRDPPDLILSDILMPRMDGFTFIREVKSRPDLRTIPFLFVTSTLVSEDDHQFAQMLGAEAIIARAEADDAALGIIREVIERHQRDDSAARSEPSRMPEPEVIEIARREPAGHTAMAFGVPAEEITSTQPDPIIRDDAPQRVIDGLQAQVQELERVNAALVQRAAQPPSNAPSDHALDTLLAQTQTRLEHRTRLTTALKEIAQMLNQSVEMDAVLDRIVQQSAELTGARDCAIFVFHSGFATFRGASAYPRSREEIQRIAFTADAADSIRAMMSAPGALAICPDLPYLSTSLLAREMNAQVAVIAPVIAQGEMLGLLVCADTPADREFSDDEMESATQLGALAGIALGQARLREHARQLLPPETDSAEDRNAIEISKNTEALVRYRAQIAALAQIAHPVAESLQPTQVLQNIVRAAKELVHAEACNLFLFNAETNTFHGVASSALAPESIQQLHFTAENNAAMLNMMRNHATLALNGAENAAKDIPMLEDAFHAKAALIVPIVARAQTLGVMLCIDSQSQRVFSFEETELLTMFADQAALWLEAAHWYYEANRQPAIAEPGRQRAFEQIDATTLALNEPLVAVLDQVHLTFDQSPNAELRLRLEGIEANTRRVVELIDQLRRITQTGLYLDG
ncbi:MAG: GAF domain-containing protein [Chloroflexi bacterium]|nr:GAF domain-containing protein [Chloroflexota bacterium]